MCLQGIHISLVPLPGPVQLFLEVSRAWAGKPSLGEPQGLARASPVPASQVMLRASFSPLNSPHLMASNIHWPPWMEFKYPIICRALQYTTEKLSGTR